MPLHSTVHRRCYVDMSADTSSFPATRIRNVYGAVATDLAGKHDGGWVVLDERWPFDTLRWFAPAAALTAVLTQPQPDTTVCTVTGVITKDTTRILKAALAQARHDDNDHLIIDLSAVTCLDLAGLYTLLEARHRHTISGGGHPVVVAMSNFSATSDSYAVIGLEASFDMYDDLAAALHACAGADSSP